MWRNPSVVHSWPTEEAIGACGAVREIYVENNGTQDDYDWFQNLSQNTE